MAAFSASQTIEVVRLGGNAIGIPGSIAIAEMLKTNKSLAVLDLRDNNIMCEGALAIAQAIDMNGTLKELHLGANNICVKAGQPQVGEAVEMLADALTRSGARSLLLLRMLVLRRWREGIGLSLGSSGFLGLFLCRGGCSQGEEGCHSSQTPPPLRLSVLRPTD